MKKGKSRILTGLATFVATVCLVGTQVAYAAPGDGLYLGGLGGFGTATVGGTFTQNGGTGTEGGGNTSKFNSGGLGADGAEWGGFLGAGFRMGVLHVSAEVEGTWSDIEIKASVAPGFTPDKGINGDNETISSASAKLWFSTAASFRLGVLLNPETLLYAKVGAVGSAFDVAYGGNKEEYWIPGVRLGAGMESTIFDGFSVRVEALHNNFYDADVYGIGSIQESGRGQGTSVELHPSGFVGRVGISYNFGSLI